MRDDIELAMMSKGYGHDNILMTVTNNDSVIL